MLKRSIPVLLAGAAVCAAFASGCANDETNVAAAPLTSALAADVATINAAADDTVFIAASPDPFLFAPATTSSLAAVSPAATSEAATSAAKSAAKLMAPAGCATATASGATATYVLKDCKGPLSSVAVTGTIAVTFAPHQVEQNMDGFILQTAATGLKVGELTIDVNRLGILTRKDNSRTLQIISEEAKATGPGGTVTMRESEGKLTWSVGNPCTTHSGTATVTLDDAPLTAKYADVVRCVGQCPRSGSVELTTQSGVGITLNYNGTSSVPFTTAAGGSGTVHSACGGMR